ncbi:MAG: hypothetical protein QM662_01230 [Gordonia sp. (in: high G+C Gram-positive bacteria)]
MPTRLRRPTTARRLASATAIAAIGVAVALGTTGCGAGQISQTANQLPAVNGGNATASWGKVELRNLAVIYPAAEADSVFGEGGPFEVTFTVVNSDPTKTYKLTRITGPASSDVDISAPPTIAPNSSVLAGTPPNSEVMPSSGTSTSSSASSSSSESAAPSSAAASSNSLTVKLKNTGTSVAAGLTTPLTFYFQVKEPGSSSWTTAGTIEAEAAVDAGLLTERRDVERGVAEEEH